MLQRWIRTGQIRVNGRRSKPFTELQAGDHVRVPPFALPLALDGAVPEPPLGGDFPPLLGSGDGIWAFNKPAGLAVQGGTDTADSLAARLAACYVASAFTPQPAHRIDKDTSGVLLVAASFAALRQLHAWLRGGQIHKEYLAVVDGSWPWHDTVLLRHFLTQDDWVRALAAPAPGSREALALARPLLRAGNATVLQLRLLTGRKRQLRAQLAFEGFPILGDRRYGGRPSPGLALHSLRMELPNGMKFSCLPSWAASYNILQLPPTLEANYTQNPG